MSEETAKRLAWETRSDFGYAEVRALDLERLLEEDLEVRVISNGMPSTGDAEGMSFDFKGEDVIIAPDYGNYRRRRFTLGHELGHILLSHGDTCCSASDIHGRGSSPQEREANVFSSRLLLPTRLFRPDIKSVRPRFSEISKVADEYETSMTATAVRYVEETKDSCALIGLRDGEAWLLKSTPVEWFVEKSPAPETLIYARLRSDSAEEVSDTPAEVWLNGFSWSGTWTVREEVFQVWDDEWLVLVSEIPDRDDDPDYTDRQIDEALERRRNRFSRY